MKAFDKSRYYIYISIFCVAILCILTFWLRMLPAPQLLTENSYSLGQEPDISYNLRLIEQTIENFPKFPSFDAMTLYPYGVSVPWGPLYTFIVSIACLVAGAVSRPEIAGVAFVIPTLLAMCMVPVMYVIGHFLHNWKTGVISASFIAIVSGQYFYRSLYGFTDHHIGEVLFSTLFCLSYIGLLVYTRHHEVDLKNKETLIVPLILAAIGGIAYSLAFYTMTTMVVFAFIVAIFTLVQFLWDYSRNRKSDYLVVINLVSFGVVTIGLLIFGVKDLSFNILTYSLAHVIAYLAIIGGTIFLFVLTRVIKQKMLYPLAIAGTVIIGTIVVFLVAPDIYASYVGGLFQFFGTQATTLTVQEARPWAINEAWFTFHFGFLLALGGICLLIYQNYREERPDNIFVLVWSSVILYATFQHVRYEYYLGPVIALLAAVCVGTVLAASWSDTWKFVARRKQTIDVEEDTGKSKKRAKAEKKSARKSAYDPLKVIVFFLIAALALLFIGMSANYNYQVGNAMGYNIMHPDWRETLEWMGSSTPDPGVDYFKIYDKSTFSYPPQSYGVMSWWDYGHWITFFAKRIPHANPFQAGVAGPTGAASFFLIPTEDQVVAIADTLGTKFVVTDIEMDTGKFWAMATWYNETLGDRPYHQIYLVTSPDNPTTYEPVSLTTQAYYLTMISRLHNFDGSMAEPSVAYYIEYRDGTTATRNYPIVTQVDVMNAIEAIVMAADYNTNAPLGSHATVLSTSLTSPISRVPALQHFRLIHESPTNVMGNSGDLRYVKAFEYVKGAHIKGEGIIEIPIVTNGGRTYLYRQESVNGEFIVPYSTEGNPYDVKATALYRISGTNVTFVVSEDTVQKGLTIN